VVLKVAHQVATPGAESAVYDCFVGISLNINLNEVLAPQVRANSIKVKDDNNAVKARDVV